MTTVRRLFVAVVLAGLLSALVFAAWPATESGLPRQRATSAIPADRKAEFLTFWESQPRVAVPVPAEGAVVLIVRFSDYQCPACAQSYLDYKPILARYAAQFPGAIRLATKDYPLERECNAAITRDLHVAACEAAVAARLARARGRGDVMEDWLYANHASLTPGAVRQAATQLGGIADFESLYEPTLNLVRSDVALGTVLNIRGTPTLLINGVRMDEVLAPEYFEMALQYELRKAGKIVD